MLFEYSPDRGRSEPFKELLDCLSRFGVPYRTKQVVPPLAEETAVLISAGISIPDTLEGTQPNGCVTLGSEVFSALVRWQNRQPVIMRANELAAKLQAVHYIR